MSKTIILFLLALPLAVLAIEPSVYGAGDLDSKNPYGLTPAEKKILQNNEKVTNLNKSVGGVQVELSRINEGYEGLRSVTESISLKIGKIDEKIRSLDEKTKDIEIIRSDLIELKEYSSEGRAIQEENQEKIKIAITELGLLIDSINKNYVDKDKFNAFVASQKAFENMVNEKLGKSAEKKTKDTFKTKDSGTIAKDADELFEKKAYNDAKVHYENLLERNYKPAKANFYLGEIAFIQKSYASAIEHYKQSIALYDKASYVPTLLYHTGISFEKLGKSKEAKGFFKALKDGYPDSSEAKKLTKNQQ
ncbi:MAG: hypothetical protein PHW07_05710 [Sulfurospirillaceae bacterium]|nr:hypothetical protein [Sulfurospirillaceae bacterium]